ncbi:Phosphoglycolate phosphatase, HAD superfamily [Nakamurella panacisegetis]|uniref:Phosphoglycolate phosphatase, HAD superfamily n=1 Tax=Nakamurella panacisegetis TaxID=1090615 RepID=A0A1H0NI68_9ACTN|nr:haloacid dehalogenase-like hydrolase [Nakamurella panacisegetis]SDO92394.1 Phosphoglycolate phosphatase, HAD superfamily [Nakamurella panacisegetis]
MSLPTTPSNPAPAVPPSRPVTAVLWDIDGTLSTTGGFSSGAFLDAVRDVAGTRPDGRDLDLGGRIDAEIATTLLLSVDADPSLVPDVLDRLRTIVMSRIDEFRTKVAPLPGVHATLARLADAGVHQTVVTGNMESIGRLKLQFAGLVPFIDPDLGGFGDLGENRAAVAALAVDRLVAAGWVHNLDQCWIVGDTPRDLACARAIGVRCALVATGRHSLASMAGLGADIVIPGLDQIDALLPLWQLPHA